jgi:RimJ/RimL family protein N-acetyltransferase
MTGNPPITDVRCGPQLVQPLLIDFVRICHELSDDERRQWVALSDGQPFDPEAMAIQLAAAAGPRWALVQADGAPLVIGGFSYLRPGVWQDWLIGTPSAWETHWRAISKHCRRVIDRMLETEAHRIQCISLADRTRAHAWYRVLGYRQEGLLRGYGANGEDAIMFARTDSNG